MDEQQAFPPELDRRLLSRNAIVRLECRRPERRQHTPALISGNENRTAGATPKNTWW
jgi:hypothetical protein